MILQYVILCHLNLRIFPHSTRSCAVVSVAYIPRVCINLIITTRKLPKNIKDKIHNLQSRRSGKMANRVFGTYKNYEIPHGCHIYQTVSDMDMDTTLAYPFTNMCYYTGYVC